MECNGKVSSGGTYKLQRSADQQAIFQLGSIPRVRSKLSHFFEASKYFKHIDEGVKQKTLDIYDPLIRDHGPPPNGMGGYGVGSPVHPPRHWVIYIYIYIYMHILDILQVYLVKSAQKNLLQGAPLHNTEFSASVISGSNSKKGFAGCRRIRRDMRSEPVIHNMR